MTLHQPLPIGEQPIDAERMAVATWRPRLSESMQSTLLSILGGLLAIIGPALLGLNAVGMYQQDVEGAFNTGVLALLAIIGSSVILRHLLSFPLLRTSTYIAVTFVSVFTLEAVCLRF